MKIRELKHADIYKLSKILKKMNLKTQVEDGASATAVGLTLFQSFAESLYLAEKEVNEWFGSLVGKTSEEMADAPLTLTIDILKQLKEVEGISNFLSQASK